MGEKLEREVRLLFKQKFWNVVNFKSLHEIVRNKLLIITVK